MLKNDIPQLVEKELRKGQEVEGIRRVFQKMDESILMSSRNDGDWEDGSTAVVALILDDKLFVANVGDAEAILSIKTKNGFTLDPVVLTTIHRPTNPDEHDRLTKKGCGLYNNRLRGCLAVSRAFGDSGYKRPITKKNYVSAKPSIYKKELDPSCEYLILASDGFWDVCTYDRAIALTERWENQDGRSLQEIARLLTEFSLLNHSQDNVSVIVVKLLWEEEDNSELDFSITSNVANKPVDVKSTSTSAGAANSQKRPNQYSSDYSSVSVYDTTSKTMSTYDPVPKAIYTGSQDAPIYLKSLQGVTLQKSYFFIDDTEHNRIFCTKTLGTKFDLPCWVC
jgi:serine/threonine protein phosphatase PrpC